MAAIKKTVTICDRDGFGKARPATQIRKFSVDGNFYKLELCDEHAHTFDREMMGWIRLAHDDESAAGVRMVRSTAWLTEEEKVKEKRAAELRAEQSRLDAEVRQLHTALQRPEQEPEPQPEPLSLAAMQWVMTPHASERAAQREITMIEALEAADHPERIYPSPAKYGERCRMHKRGDVAVAVDPGSKLIITVMPRDGSVHDTWQTTQPAGAHR